MVCGHIHLEVTWFGFGCLGLDVMFEGDCVMFALKMLGLWAHSG